MISRDHISSSPGHSFQYSGIIHLDCFLWLEVSCYSSSVHIHLIPIALIFKPNFKFAYIFAQTNINKLRTWAHTFESSCMNRFAILSHCIITHCLDVGFIWWNRVTGQLTLRVPYVCVELLMFSKSEEPLCWFVLLGFLSMIFFRSGNCSSNYSAATEPRASYGARWCLSSCRHELLRISFPATLVMQVCFKG